MWLDQLDIAPGQRWAKAVQESLNDCLRMLVILSPASANSTNVDDEISFALEEEKTVIPVLYRDCKIPFRLRPFQYVDFRGDYARGLKELVSTLAGEPRERYALAPDRDRGPRGVAHSTLTTELKQKGRFFSGMQNWRRTTLAICVLVAVGFVSYWGLTAWLRSSKKLLVVPESQHSMPPPAHHPDPEVADKGTTKPAENPGNERTSEAGAAGENVRPAGKRSHLLSGTERPSAPAPTALKIPACMEVCMGGCITENSHNVGTWTFNGLTGRGTWPSGSVAILTIKRFDRDKILIHDENPSDSHESGLIADYEGTMHDGRIDGTVTQTWAKLPGGTRTVPWYATIPAECEKNAAAEGTGVRP